MEEPLCDGVFDFEFERQVVAGVDIPKEDLQVNQEWVGTLHACTRPPARTHTYRS